MNKFSEDRAGCHTWFISIEIEETSDLTDRQLTD
jgi:hypothetical protein